MNVSYRSIARNELGEAGQVFLSGVNDLARRRGLPPPTYSAQAIQPLYEHLFDTGSFDVAEEGGRIVAIASGIQRDDIWFLSMFWILPELRGRGVARPLLERIVEKARENGAKIFCTWSSIDFVALANYLRLGWLPECPILTFAGELTRRPQPPSGFSLRALEPSVASSIDASVRGTPRPVDHAFFRARGTQGVQLEKGSTPVAYFYAERGVIGPAAWLDAAHGPALVAHALESAAQQANEIKLMTLGVNHAAIRASLAAGLRLVSTSHWVSSGAFGALSQYLPSGPGVF